MAGRRASVTDAATAVVYVQQRNERVEFFRRII